MANPMYFSDFKLGDKKLSDFNGVLYNNEDGNVINLAPSITHITEQLANQDGEFYVGSRIESRSIDVSVYFEGDVDIQGLTAWLCKKEPQSLMFVGDNKKIDVIYNSSLSLTSFYGRVYQGLLDISFIAYDPYFRISEEQTKVISSPVNNTKYEVPNNGNVEAYPVIKIKPNGTQSLIKFKLNDLLITLHNVNKELYIDCEFEEVYELNMGTKILTREKFFSTDYYEFPILEPFITNQITVLEGQVSEITVVPNSRIL